MKEILVDNACTEQELIDLKKEIAGNMLRKISKQIENGDVQNVQASLQLKQHMNDLQEDAMNEQDEME